MLQLYFSKPFTILLSRLHLLLYNTKRNHGESTSPINNHNLWPPFPVSSSFPFQILSAMEPSDIESVLHFFRKNHLSVSESALIDDIFEKSQVGSSDFHNFLFPPSLPPLKIPAARCLPPPLKPAEDLATSDASSDQEFISLGSSTTDLCSSGTHPSRWIFIIIETEL